jgi:hypothetical protein
MRQVCHRQTIRIGPRILVTFVPQQSKLVSMTFKMTPGYLLAAVATWRSRLLQTRPSLRRLRGCHATFAYVEADPQQFTYLAVLRHEFGDGRQRHSTRLWQHALLLMLEHSRQLLVRPRRVLEPNHMHCRQIALLLRRMVLWRGSIRR